VIEYLHYVVPLAMAIVFAAYMLYWMGREGFFTDSLEKIMIVLGMVLMALLMPYLIIGVATTLALLATTLKIIEIVFKGRLQKNQLTHHPKHTKNNKTKSKTEYSNQKTKDPEDSIDIVLDLT